MNNINVWLTKNKVKGFYMFPGLFDMKEMWDVIKEAHGPSFNWIVCWLYMSFLLWAIPYTSLCLLQAILFPVKEKEKNAKN